MANDPKFVRLAERLTGQVLVDITSGWSISGLDVQEFPDATKYPNAARFVRDKLRRGALEPASQAEYEEVEETHQASREAFQARVQELAELGMADRVGLAIHQEAQVQEQARQRREKVRQTRAEETPSEEEEEDGTYQSMTVKQLRDELDERGLETSGNKPDLVARLEADDAEEEEDDES